MYQLVVDSSFALRRSSLKSLMRWQLRGKLPISVEATLGFLTIMCQDEFFNGCDNIGFLSESILELSYGQVIVRFVNLLIDSAQEGTVAVSMEKVAASVDIPGWVIQCRHSVTHGKLTPSLAVLRATALYLLNDYILVKYWHAQRLIIPNDELTSDVDTVYGIELLVSYFQDSVSKDEEGRILNLVSQGALGTECIHWISQNSETDVTSRYMKWQNLLIVIAKTSLRDLLFDQLLYYFNIPLLRLLATIDEVGMSLRLRILELPPHLQYRLPREFFADLMS